MGEMKHNLSGRRCVYQHSVFQSTAPQHSQSYSVPANNVGVGLMRPREDIACPIGTPQMPSQDQCNVDHWQWCKLARPGVANIPHNDLCRESHPFSLKGQNIWLSFFAYRWTSSFHFFVCCYKLTVSSYGLPPVPTPFCTGFWGLFLPIFILIWLLYRSGLNNWLDWLP